MTTTNPYIHTYYVNLRNGADIRREKQPLASGDKNADIFLVHLQDGGKVVSLDGVAVTGKVIRADGHTVPLTGSVADGAAKITLDENCYAVPGEIKLTVTVSAGDVVQSVLIVTMDVQTSETSIVVDNGVIGTLSELLAEIENMRTATQEARETVDAANTALDKTAADAQAAITQAIRDTDAAVTEIREVATQAAPPIVAEADGALVAIRDGAARPVVRLVSSMAAVQAGSGEPSPENVRAITGWDAVKVWRTGRNLLDASSWPSRTTSGVTLTNNGDGSVTVTGTNTAASVVNLSGTISLTLKPGTYTVSGCGSTAEGCYSVVTYRRTGTNAFAYGCKTFEIDAEQTVTCVIQVGVGATVDMTLWPMIEAGGSASAFEPYQVAELTAALPETVYGGRLDWVSGLLTVTHGLITLDGTEAWASNGGTQYYTTDELPRTGVSAVYPVCTHYPGGNAYTGSIANGVLVSPTKIWLRDARFDNDTAGLKAWLTAQAAAGTPVQIVYLLAEPYTVQIDPQVLETLRGSNVIWSDCGNTAVSYVVDTKTYVDAHAVGGSGGSVASVNGKTGAVVLNAADVGAMPADAQIVDTDAREQIAELSEQIDELKENGISGNWGEENAHRIIATDGSGNQVVAEVDEAFEVSTVVQSGVLATVNLYDETSMAVKGAWYVGSAGAITFQQNGNTTHYTAIAIPLHNAEEVTLFSYAEYPRIYKWFIADENQIILTQSDAAINRDLHVDAFTIPVPEGGDTLYISGRNNWIGVKLMVNVGAEASPYAPYNGVSDDPTSTTHFKRKNDVELSLPERYELVVGDTFELFWKGVVKALNPDMYYIEAVCGKGAPYQRRFLFEPTAADVGEHTLTVNVYDQMHILLASGNTKLVVKAKVASPATEKVVLYVGDSLANGGQVPDELHRRLTASDGTPVGDGLSNITFIGTCSSARNSVPYEGYGGWTFASYNTENKSAAYMWITASGHGKTDDDQHSVYKDTNDVEWKIETIETGRIKIIRTSSSGNLPATGSLTWVSGGVNTGAIAYTASEQAAGNPFWDDTAGKVDFASYAAEQSKTNIDHVYVLLGWNGMTKSDEVIMAEATTFIGNVHASFPNCQVVLLGLQIPARDGLAANYGASETWTYYNAMSHVMRLNRLYEQIAKDTSNVSFVQVSGQFDTDYNMPTRERTVNVRSSTKETYQSNGIHPLTAGYYQIADACYRDFVHKLQE